MSERLAAHERLSTGALARWMRACASHPWRVIGGWVAILAVLIGLVATVGGSLRDEFTIPGSDTQKATDLIEAEFASEQGGVLNVVFAAPPGERLDTPERREAIESAIARLRSDEFKPQGDEAGLTSVADPFADATAGDNKLVSQPSTEPEPLLPAPSPRTIVSCSARILAVIAPSASCSGESAFIAFIMPSRPGGL